ncbi:unnamed protein product [Rhodiola kirilowii]
MVVNHRPFKRLKRRVSADLHDFVTFLTADEDFVGAEPFRTAVKSFVSKYGRPSTYSTPLFTSLVTWQVAFGVGDGEEVLMMEVVEEDVTRSASVYCNQCRVIGWSAHPVCNKRYHFIIRANSGTMDKGYKQPCASCGNFLHLRDESCRTCGAMVTPEELDNWANRQFEDSNFLLHGLIHSNGYGHLLTLNGREGGSKSVSGCDMMNFWDRLCKALSVNKVSLMDVSKKYGMEYRLLHTVSQGRTWYGNWGYEFGIGCYGISKEAYRQAVETISTMPLSTFFFKRRNTRSQLQAVIKFYQSLSDSKLVTFRDLFSLLLRLIREVSTSNNVKYCTTSSTCCWADEDVERVQRGMLKILTAAHPSSNWISHKALKGAMSQTASPELLHYCLKHLEGTVSQNRMAVKARCNPNSSTVEYRLEGPSSWYDCWNQNRPSKEQLIRDLKLLYDSILNPKTVEVCMSHATKDSISKSMSKILDCKQLVKNYEPERMAQRGPTSIFVWCQVELIGEPRDNPIPPQELIILPSNATFADLKRRVAEAFKEVYAMFRTFSIIEMPDIGRVDDSMTLQLLIGSYGAIRVRGKCDRIYGLSCFRTEKGTESWIVDCVCGATDDDGEPMLACDACGIWQHTRCVGLSSSEDIPEQFTCSICVNNNHHKGNEITEEKPLLLSQSHIPCCKVSVRQKVSALSCCMPLDKCVKAEVSEWVPQSNTCRDQVAAAGDPLTFAYDVR